MPLLIQHQVLIDITAYGDVASGKSLAISDMLQGLKEYGHFVIGSQQNDKNHGTERIQVMITLRKQHVMEHD